MHNHGFHSSFKCYQMLFFQVSFFIKKLLLLKTVSDVQYTPLQDHIK